MREAAMRLTCPSCGATYALGEDAMPSGGSHVQCAACHTRWFARPEGPAAENLSEDEIVARLETRAARPRIAGGTEAGPAPAAAASVPIAFPGSARPAASEPGATAAPAPAREAAADRVSDAAAPVVAPDPPSAAAAAAPGPPTPLRPRHASDRTRPGAAFAPRPSAPERRAGFGFGLVAALALAAAALGVFLAADEASERAPAVAPALAAYVDSVDEIRFWIEARLGPVRETVTGG